MLRWRMDGDIVKMRDIARASERDQRREGGKPWGLLIYVGVPLRGRQARIRLYLEGYTIRLIALLDDA